MDSETMEYVPSLGAEVIRALVRRCLATTEQSVREEIKQVLLQAARGEFDHLPAVSHRQNRSGDGR